MKINQAIRKEAEITAAMFEYEELERYRRSHSFVYRHSETVSISCLATFLVSLIVFLFMQTSTMQNICVACMFLATTLLGYSIFRASCPEDSFIKVIGRLTLSYIAIGVIVALAEVLR